MKQYLFNMVACRPLPLQALLSRYAYDSCIYGYHVYNEMLIAMLGEVLLTNIE